MLPDESTSKTSQDLLILVMAPLHALTQRCVTLEAHLLMNFQMLALSPCLRPMHLTAIEPAGVRLPTLAFRKGFTARRHVPIHVQDMMRANLLHKAVQSSQLHSMLLNAVSSCSCTRNPLETAQISFKCER